MGLVIGGIKETQELAVHKFSILVCIY